MVTIELTSLKKDPEEGAHPSGLNGAGGKTAPDGGALSPPHIDSDKDSSREPSGALAATSPTGAPSAPGEEALSLDSIRATWLPHDSPDHPENARVTPPSLAKYPTWVQGLYRSLFPRARPATNEVITAKYTYWNFLPKNIFFQFNNVAMTYFLLIILLQVFSALRAWPFALTPLPLVIVLVSAAVKDLYEDIKRHRIDRSVNYSATHKFVDGLFVETHWRDIRRGDILLVGKNETFPADMLILATSDGEAPTGAFFVETKSLDGETNLKPRFAPRVTSGLRSQITLAAMLRGPGLRVSVPAPSYDMNSLEGVIHVGGATGTGTTTPFNISSVALRGSSLRTTEWVIGVALYVGTSTRIVKHTSLRPHKRTSMDRILNRQILVLLTCTVLLCVVVGVVHGVRMAHLLDIQPPVPFLSLRWTSPGLVGFMAVFTMMIITQNIVPIALYASLEFIRLMQSYFIREDDALQHRKTGERCIPRSWNIHDNLGQIEYIFTDKTGTLTTNEMRFRFCTVNGRAYGMESSADLRRTRSSPSLDRMTDYLQADPSRQAPDLERGVASTRRAAAAAGGFLPGMVADHHPEDVLLPMSVLSPSGEMVLIETVSGPPSWQVQNRQNPCFAAHIDSDFHFADRHMAEHLMQSYDLRWSSLAEAAERLTPDQYHVAVLAEFQLALALCHSVQSELLPHGGEADDRADGQHHHHHAGDDGCLAGHRHHHHHPADGLAVIGGDTGSVGSRGSSSPTDSDDDDPTIGDDPLHGRCRHRAASSKAGPGAGAGAGVAGMVPPSPSMVAAAAQPHDYSGDDAAFRIAYSGSSSDETSLVKAAKNFGYVFRERDRDTVSVTVLGSQVRRFNQLHQVDFDSTRKMMSVVVTPAGATAATGPGAEDMVYVYSKGDDSSILPRLSTAAGRNDPEAVAAARHGLHQYSQIGLRTLCIGYRAMRRADFDAWMARYQAALAEADDGSGRRDALLGRLTRELETDLTLLGVTAIEDRLQDGVPEALEQLQLAGMNVWVLTGDKCTTAVNIATACRLIRPGDMLHPITRDVGALAELAAEFRLDADALTGPGAEAPSMDQLLSQAEAAVMAAASSAGEGAASSPSGHVAVLDGTFFEGLAQHQDRFLRLAQHFRSVICCRISPLEKAEIVRLVKESDMRRGLTLAIGDGANDVSMIQTAHIGVGISGNEGRQAVAASDYSLARFRFLRRLLLVHGRWSYSRMTEAMYLFFQKNFTLTFPMFMYQIVSMASAQMMYHFSYQMFYNLAFTCLPPIVVAIFDQPNTSQAALLFPQLYRDYHKRFSTRMFWLNCLDGLFQGLVCFTVYFMMLADELAAVTSADGRTIDQVDAGFVLISCIVGCCLVTFTLQTNHMSWLGASGIVLSAAIFLVYHVVAAYLPIVFFFDLYGVMPNAFSTPGFWLVLLLVLVTGILPRLVYCSFSIVFLPDDQQLVRELERSGQHLSCPLADGFLETGELTLLPVVPSREDQDELAAGALSSRAMVVCSMDALALLKSECHCPGALVGAPCGHRVCVSMVAGHTSKEALLLGSGKEAALVAGSAGGGGGPAVDVMLATGTPLSEHKSSAFSSSASSASSADGDIGGGGGVAPVAIAAAAATAAGPKQQHLPDIAEAAILTTGQQQPPPSDGDDDGAGGQGVAGGDADDAHGAGGGPAAAGAAGMMTPSPAGQQPPPPPAAAAAPADPADESLAAESTREILASSGDEVVVVVSVPAAAGGGGDATGRRMSISPLHSSDSDSSSGDDDDGSSSSDSSGSSVWSSSSDGSSFTTQNGSTSFLTSTDESLDVMSHMAHGGAPPR
ncbi:hypothetical protein H696_05363 [Fonticula alba]|uniref:P-type phospholipid transporter n=1 Tax=Fonticula alba TaxID=691883 RepID=A0A058Z1H5_FONAL|nr:hypothetical protein H696_05363 [Fonticula alba]KCV68110.1 hypothetical protein H696_05363 [Fonticula alba]|eukprot:XP_009497484.1 hypothetical protein H696_05363 [Fonticula alba]